VTYVLVALTVAAALLLPVPYVALSPGPVYDVLGDVDGEPVVQITGAQTFPTDGRLDLTTVLQQGGAFRLTMGSAMLAWLLPNRTVEPEVLRFPPGTDAQQEAEVSRIVFEASASSATGAAAEYLGRPVQVETLVSQVEPGSPAAGTVEVGDVVTALAGQPVQRSADVFAIMAEQEPGVAITMTVERDGASQDLSLTPAEPATGRPGGFLGVLLVDRYSSDFTAEIALQGIGGPSAGLVFALAMVDELTPEDIFGGEHVAGTGTIAADGTVGPIGGIEKKVVSASRAGATLFLAPEANCADLVDRVPDGLTVVPVPDLSAAVDSVTAWREGKRDLPACPAG
jgi:PDZ domain-containing protein